MVGGRVNPVISVIIDNHNNELQVLLQSVTGITKSENFITKCDRYYKVRRLLQSMTEHSS